MVYRWQANTVVSDHKGDSVSTQCMYSKFKIKNKYVVLIILLLITDHWIVNTTINKPHKSVIHGLFCVGICMQVEYNKTFPHLSTSDSQQLSERYDGSPTMKVHQVLQKPMRSVFAHNDIMAILQCINHEMSAAVRRTDIQRHGNENYQEDWTGQNFKMFLFEYANVKGQI